MALFTGHTVMEQLYNGAFDCGPRQRASALFLDESRSGNQHIQISSSFASVVQQTTEPHAIWTHWEDSRSASVRVKYLYLSIHLSYFLPPSLVCLLARSTSLSPSLASNPSVFLNIHTRPIGLSSPGVCVCVCVCVVLTQSLLWVRGCRFRSPRQNKTK